VENKLYILEIIRGQFNPYELVEKILLSAYLWRPRVVAIEKSPGAQFLMPALESKSQQLQIPVPNIHWIKLTPDKSKYERVSALQPLLANGRLFFSTAISDKDQLITEFTRFPAYRHNDIPDAISLLLNVFPTGIAYVPEESGTLPVPVVTGDGMLGAGLIG
jgi:predicted phage terminase large subunit-like protein